jgi:hypothetical protein
VNSKALSLDDRCVKAMYRRAQAYKVTRLWKLMSNALSARRF